MDKKIKRLKEEQNDIFLAMADILSGISSPIRIRLIHFLSQGPLTVEILANKIEQTMANTSMHLRKMLAVKIVDVKVQGKQRLYTLNPKGLSFWEACQDFIQALRPELKLSLVEEDINWSKNLKETLKMAKKKEVQLVDARPKEEVSEKLEKLGVLHIPSENLDAQSKKLPKNKPVLVFCRGRFCALSAYVVTKLRSAGIDAYRLNESWYSLKTHS